MLFFDKGHGADFTRLLDKNFNVPVFISNNSNTDSLMPNQYYTLDVKKSDELKIQIKDGEFNAKVI